LLEETGFEARSIHRLGDSSPCTGRLNNRIHAFFVETGEQVADPEPGMRVELVSAQRLARMIMAGEFISQLHIGSLMLAQLSGFLTLPQKTRAKRRQPPAKRPGVRKSRIHTKGRR
jgi:hypothetical protein